MSESQPQEDVAVLQSPGPWHRLVAWLESGQRQQRVNTIDFFRCVAIVSVVLFHYGYMPGGSLGVDLFFLISGYLVSKPLVAALEKRERIDFRHFFLYRGFKIWPSLYSFLAAGLVLHMIFYQPDQPDIRVAPNFIRYVLLYCNYDPFPVWYHFQHVWSLCVEEHFYILLPLVFMLAARLGQKEDRAFRYLMGLLLALIGLSIVSKLLGLSTLTATQNRLDALCEGVLLRLLIDKYQYRCRSPMQSLSVTAAGVLLFGAVAAANLRSAPWLGGHPQFDGSSHLAYVSFIFIPISFFLIMWGMMYFNIRFFGFKLIAHFSYNWYLWHQFIAVYLRHRYPGPAGLILYLVVGFALAVITTVYIEKRFLDIRARWKLQAT